MKKQLLAAVITLAAASVLAQGTVTFGTTFTGQFVMPIFGPDPADPILGVSGIPFGINGVVPSSGTVTYRGPLLQGTGYTLQFWAGPTNTALQPLFTTTFRTAIANKLPAGLVSGTTTITVPGVLPGQRAWYQIRVWNNLGGTVTNFSPWPWGGVLNFSTDVGVSAVVQSSPLGGIDQNSQSWPTPISTNWVSFNTWGDVCAPRISSINPLSQFVAAGSYASIHAEAQPSPDSPAYYYVWYFNGTNRLAATNSTLVLTNLQVQQSGAYSVYGWNECGLSLPFQPAMLSVLPRLDIDSGRTLTLYGGVGVTFRIDYVNALGPTNAWVPLDTVTMTNNPQTYFDVAAIGQPARLYRLVQLP